MASGSSKKSELISTATDAVTWNSPSNDEDLSHDFDRLKISQNTDVFLQVEGHRFPANSQILRAHSPFFADMLKNDTESGARVIKISDCGALTIDCILHYLQNGELSNVENMTLSSLIELYRTVNKYAIGEMKNVCSNTVALKISEDNVKEIAALAQMYNDLVLIRCIVYFFARNRKIIFSDVWDDVDDFIPDISERVLNALEKEQRK